MDQVGLGGLTWTDVWMGLVVVFAALGAAHYATWIFSTARRERMVDRGSWVVDLIANVVDDFRHLLAAGFLLIFASALVASIVLAKDLLASIQTVVGSFGPLMGAVIGYYFGESRRAGRGTGAEGGLIDQHDPPPDDPVVPAEQIREDNAR